ncbi:unnamed protein product [Brassica rapa subsp. narinosa]
MGTGEGTKSTTIFSSMEEVSFHIMEAQVRYGVLMSMVFDYAGPWKHSSSSFHESSRLSSRQIRRKISMLSSILFHISRCAP